MKPRNRKIKPQYIVLIAIAVLIIIVVAIYFLKGFVKYQPTQADQNSLVDQYNITSPWGWPETNPDGSYVKKDGKIQWRGDSSIPVDGPDGKCVPYTWKPLGRFDPGFPFLKSLAPEQNTNTRVISANIDQSCIDDDQMKVRKNKHMCRGDTITGFRTNGQCLGNNRSYFPEGKVEEFWTVCGGKDKKPPERCKGDIGLLSYKFSNKVGEGLNNAQCMGIPDYVENKDTGGYDLPNNITFSSCNMTYLNKNSGPLQIFRIQRFNIQGGKYVIADSGKFIRIVHRETGAYLGPQLTDKDLSKPALGVRAVLLTSNQYDVPKGQLDPKGAWWFAINDDQVAGPGGKWQKQQDGAVTPVEYKWTAPLGLLYIPNPADLPANYSDQRAIWKIFVKGPPPLPATYSKPENAYDYIKEEAPPMLMFKPSSGTMPYNSNVTKTGELIVNKMYIYDSKGGTEAKAMKAIADQYRLMFFPAPIINIINSSPSGYGSW